MNNSNNKYPYADTAAINLSRLNTTTGNNKSFPKTARNYTRYILLNADNSNALITITHGETPNHSYSFTAQVAVTATAPFFNLLGLEPRYFDTLERSGGCGYDRHNSVAMGIIRRMGIEPYGEGVNHGGIYGGGIGGSERILAAIANYLESIGVNTALIEA